MCFSFLRKQVKIPSKFYRTASLAFPVRIGCISQKYTGHSLHFNFYFLYCQRLQSTACAYLRLYIKIISNPIFCHAVAKQRIVSFILLPPPPPPRNLFSNNFATLFSFETCNRATLIISLYLSRRNVYNSSSFRQASRSLMKSR